MYTHIHTYIHTYTHNVTLHYITLHYVTLHYITLHYITRSAIAGRTVWRCSVLPVRPRASRHPRGSASSAVQPSQPILSRRLSGQAGADQDELSLRLSAPGLRPFLIQACVASCETGRVKAVRSQEMEKREVTPQTRRRERQGAGRGSLHKRGGERGRDGRGK